MMNKNGQVNLNKKIEIPLIIILTVVILFSLYAAFIPEVQRAGDSLNDSNRCNAIGCFYNTSAGTTSNLQGCRANSSLEANTTSCGSNLQTIPISRFFRSGGIIVLLLMAALLIVIVRMVLPKRKK